METVLNTIKGITAVLKKLFGKAKPAPAINEHEQMLRAVSKAENLIYKSIIIQLENDPAIPKYGTEVKMLHRRLAQYERMRTSASLADQNMALKKLEKQWKKVGSHSHKINNNQSCNKRADEAGRSLRTEGLS